MRLGPTMPTRSSASATVPARNARSPGGGSGAECGSNAHAEPEPRRLGQPTRRLTHLPQLAAEADLRARDQIGGSGVSESDDATARASARSAPGSTTRTPPTARANTSDPASGAVHDVRARRAGTPACPRRRLARIVVAAAGSSWPRALGARRAADGGRRAWARPPSPARRVAGRRGTARSASGTGSSPASVISNSPSSAVDPNRCFAARSSRSA